MGSLDSVPEHNMCAYLDKGHPISTDYHDLFDFLSNSKLSLALSVNPRIYKDHIKSFWSSAAYSDQGVPSITATVDGKQIIITESLIRTTFAFDDANGKNEFNAELVHETFLHMGYEGSFTDNTIWKNMLSYNWRYLVHVFLHCLSPKRSGWDSIDLQLASGIVGLVTGRSFNYSGLIFQGMRYTLQEGSSEQFLMYPRFLQYIFNRELQNLSTSSAGYMPYHIKYIVLDRLKNYDRKCTFSKTFTPLFAHMRGVAAAKPVSNSVYVHSKSDSTLPASTSAPASTSQPQSSRVRDENGLINREMENVIVKMEVEDLQDTITKLRKAEDKYPQPRDGYAFIDLEAENVMLKQEVKDLQVTITKLRKLEDKNQRELSAKDALIAQLAAQVAAQHAEIHLLKAKSFKATVVSQDGAPKKRKTLAEQDDDV